MLANALITTGSDSFALDLMQDFLSFGHSMNEAARLASQISKVPAARLLILMPATTNG